MSEGTGGTGDEDLKPEEGDEVGAAAALVADDQPAADDPPADPPASDADEALARALGWRPKDEFTGNPDNWVPADRFAAKMRTRMDTVDKLQQRLDAVERSKEEEIAGVKRLAKAAYDRDIARLQADRKQAVEMGEVETFERIDKEIDDLQKTVQPQPAKPQVAPEVVAFQARNPWFNTSSDPMHVAASQWAIARSNQLFAQGVTDPAAQIAQIEQEMPAAFPTLGGKPAAQPQPAPPKATTVDGGSDSHARRLVGGKAQPRYDAMPASAKAQFEELVRLGMAQDTPEDRAWAAKTYQESA